MSEKGVASLPEGRRVRQGLLDLLSSNDFSDDQKVAVAEAVALLQETENKLLQEEKPTVTISQLKKLYDVRSVKRGVHIYRDELIYQYVELSKRLYGSAKEVTVIYGEAAELAGIADTRTIEKILKESTEDRWYPSFDAEEGAEDPSSKGAWERYLNHVALKLKSLTES